jgi:hypothetical protein
MNKISSDADILSAVTQLARPDAVAKTPLTRVSKDAVWTIPGFYGKSRVSTSFGHLPIEALRRRDQLKTPSGAFLEVEWIDTVKLDVDFLEHHPEAHPIFIPKNALGVDRPYVSTLVSPAQKVKEPGKIGSDNLKPAASLVGRTKASRMPHSGFVYYVFHCGQPTQVSVDGLWFDVRP